MNKKYIIIAPCFNEKDAISKFLKELESTLSSTTCTFLIIVVDDYSTDSTIDILKSFEFNNSRFELNVIRLNCNLGHQEAIRQGLIHASKIDLPVDGVFVMDSDGEDDPKAIQEALELDDFDIIFFERGKRSENLKFRLGYFFYKMFFKLVTGKQISFGNFSLINQSILHSISNQHFFHYASFLSKQKVEIKKIRYDRRKRLDGVSKMNYKTLIFHGLYSIIEFSEEILFSFIKMFIFILVLLFGIGFYVIYSKFISEKAIPGWTSTISSNLALGAVMIIGFLTLGLLVLSIKKIIAQKNGNYNQIR